MPASNPFTQIRSNQRLEVLRSLQLLDTPTEPAFDRLTKLASAITESPVALVTLVDIDRQFFKSQIGLPEPWASLRETPLSHSFCKHVVADNAPLVVEDARRHPMLKDNLAVPDLGVVGYLGMPLTTNDGVRLGSLCVIDFKPRQWRSHDMVILRDLAGLVMTEVELRAQIRARKEAEDSLKEYTETLEIRVIDRTRELKAANERLQSLDRLRSKLIRDFSHELRTPITNLKLYLDLYFDGKPESRSKYEKILRAESERLAALCDAVLEFAMLHYALDSAALSSVDMIALTSGIVAEFGDEASEAGLDLSFASDTNAAYIWGYPQHLKEFVRHLLANAIAYTAEGAVRVNVFGSGDEDRVVLTVQDTGIGMDEEEQVQCFDRLYRGKRVGGFNSQAGAGLGLARAKSIVEFHDGLIEVDSEIDEGTVFTVHLPLRLEERSAL